MSRRGGPFYAGSHNQLIVDHELNEAGLYSSFDSRLDGINSSINQVINNSLRKKVYKNVSSPLSSRDQYALQSGLQDGHVEEPFYTLSDSYTPSEHHLSLKEASFPNTSVDHGHYGSPGSRVDTTWLSTQCEAVHSPIYGQSPTPSLRYREEVHEARYHSPQRLADLPEFQGPAHTPSRHTHMPVSATRSSPRPPSAQRRAHKPNQGPLLSQSAQASAGNSGYLLPLTYHEYISVLAQRHQQAAGLVTKPLQIDAHPIPTTLSDAAVRSTHDKYRILSDNIDSLARPLQRLQTSPPRRDPRRRPRKPTITAHSAPNPWGLPLHT